MKLLLADAFPPGHLDVLASNGHDCTYQPDLSAEGLAPALPGIEGLVVRSTVVGEQAIAAADDLRLVIRAGSGFNTIAVAAAAARGIQVSNVPGKNAIAVAELVMGLIISIDRNIPDNVAELRAGRWDKARFSEATGVAGRRLGIIGVGNVGLALAHRAAAFGMTVVVVAKEREETLLTRLDALGVQQVASEAELLSSCDVVTVHVPYTGEVVVDADFLSSMKDGAILINTSRGDVVDEDALIAALDTRGMRAGLDVFRDEPASRSGEFRSKLAQHPNVYGTHHIGASTAQAQLSVADEVVAIIEDFERGVPRNVVA